MDKAGIYARFSTRKMQSETSLEDQVRRCREVAVRHGYEVSEELTFCDAAISGSDKALFKRDAYHRLIAMLEQRGCDAVVVDEISRLARDLGELMEFRKIIKEKRIRLLTADGIDSNVANWELMFSINGALSEHFLNETRHRVIRGMQGQLIRGYMISDAAYGYRLERELDKEGAPIGTRWQIDDVEAEVVRQLFAWRLAGWSFGAMARELNGRGIALPRAPRSRAIAEWKPASVRRILTNTVYRGVFVWNGSAFARAKAKKKKVVLEEVEYKRPDLRLVDDKTWSACNVPGEDRPFRGNRKHVFAGFARCGDCNCVLSLSGKSGETPRLYCATCAQAFYSGFKTEKMGYVGTGSLRQALLAVVERIFSPRWDDEFKEMLRKRLQGDRSSEIREVRKQMAKATRGCRQLASLLRESKDVGGILAREYQKAEQQGEECAERLASLELADGRVDQEAIERQLQVNPMEDVRASLDAPPDVEKANKVFRRLFSSVKLVSRPRRYLSVWEVTCIPGVAYAEVTASTVQEERCAVFRVTVALSARRPVEWSVAIEQK